MGSFPAPSSSACELGLALKPACGCGGVGLACCRVRGVVVRGVPEGAQQVGGGGVPKGASGSAEVAVYSGAPGRPRKVCGRGMAGEGGSRGCGGGVVAGGHSAMYLIKKAARGRPRN